MLSILSLIFGAVSKLLGPIFGFATAEVNDKATVEVATIESMGAVEQKWWFVALTIPLFAIPAELYLFKAMAWDKVLGPMFGFHSSTAALGPDLHLAFWIILSGIFLHAMVN